MRWSPAGWSKKAWILLSSRANTTGLLSYSSHPTARHVTRSPAIEKAVTDAGINIEYVDVTKAFAGHGIGCQQLQPLACTVPFINPPGTGINAFHPTAAGYVAYAEAISAVLPSSLED